jgi:NAD(P)H-hydrate epimerase
MSKLLSLDKPTLVDADGIKTLNRCKYTRKRPIVVTPHRKEFEILTGMEATEDNAYSYARKTGNVVLLKGKVDIITDGKRIIHSPGGNARMTMGGTGDLLAGIVAALLAKGIDELHASALGSFINKKVGENAFLRHSYWFGIMDMVNTIPETMAWMYNFCYETRD